MKTSLNLTAKQFKKRIIIKNKKKKERNDISFAEIDFKLKFAKTRDI